MYLMNFWIQVHDISDGHQKAIIIKNEIFILLSIITRFRSEV
jgi:hypothetical protein